MSEFTADNAMGSSDITIGDNEPSMEDILASIRKIIADDKTGEMATSSDITEDIAPLELEVETEEMAFPDMQKDDVSSGVDAEEAQDAVLMAADIDSGETADIAIRDAAPEELETVGFVDDEEDILELINFVDDNHGGALNTELTNLESPEEPLQAIRAEIAGADSSTDSDIATTGFDEGLDLVMDADASDYATTTFESSDIKAESWKDIKSAAEHVDPDMESVEERLASAQQQLTQDMSNEEQDVLAVEIDDVAEPEDITDMYQAEAEITEDILAVEDAEDNLDDSDDEYEVMVDEDAAFEDVAIEDEAIEDEALEDGETLRATPDQDMTLVKSLLADLMDEPSDDTGQDDFAEEALVSSEEDTAETPNTVLDNILNSSIEDEVQAQISESVEDSAESDLARIAREAFESTDIAAAEALSDDDIVDLGDGDISSKFALVAGTALAGGAVIAASDSDIEVTDDLEEFAVTDYNVENETELGQDEQALQELIAPEEDEPMVRVVKTESLVDEGTQKESSSAFASLTSAVNEKTKLEESGPAIGDLVQEALKPMLSEWLDKNLKGIVERAVTKEVKRISSGK